MNTVKLILTAVLSFSLFGCGPAKYDKNGKECPPITHGVPECEDEDLGAKLPASPQPTQTPAGIRN